MTTGVPVLRMRAITVPAAADEITAMIEDVFTALTRLRDQVEGVYADRADAGALPSVTDLAGLSADIKSVLGMAGGAVVGCGFVTDVGMLADRQRWLEWWKGEVPDSPRRLEISLDPTSEEFLDYTKQPWFSGPKASGQRNLTGPYVDYLCTDEYSLTLTVPVHDGDQFVGIVGADIYVRLLEPVLLPVLRPLAEPTALVSANGRVVVSTSTAHASGSLVRSPEIAALWPQSGQTDGAGPDAARLHRCGALPLGLLELPSEPERNRFAAN